VVLIVLLVIPVHLYHQTWGNFGSLPIEGVGTKCSLGLLQYKNTCHNWTFNLRVLLLFNIVLSDIVHIMFKNYKWSVCMWTDYWLLYGKPLLWWLLDANHRCKIRSHCLSPHLWSSQLVFVFQVDHRKVHKPLHHFFLLRYHEPCEKPYNDTLEYGFLISVKIYIFNISYTLKKKEFSARVGTIVDQKKVPKQAGVVHNIKSQ